ncbi:MAG TPA: hypothetical protein VMU68_10455 [Acidimicrobiales bacterium]|nr:hypothetical protein [Acidimicrobiales bacterium]
MALRPSLECAVSILLAATASEIDTEQVVIAKRVVVDEVHDVDEEEYWLGIWRSYTPRDRSNQPS